jgi:plasminogen
MFADCMTDLFRYTGRKSTTSDGYECQRWDSQSPHAHEYTEPRMFPDRELADASNYCRMLPLEGANVAYCLTTDTSVSFDTCEIDWCIATRKSLHLSYY